MKKRLRELADFVGGTVIGDGDIEISGVGAIETAQSGEITFIAHPKYLSLLSETRASAIIASPDVAKKWTSPFSPSPTLIWPSQRS